MAILFFGTPDFAVPSLNALLDAGEDISLVVTQPDRRKGRDRSPSPTAVKKAATAKRIQVLQPMTVKDSVFFNSVSAQQPEFIVVVAYGQVLPSELLQVPSRGCINVHASLLPAYRGAAPIQWSLINGDQKTGITTMLMDPGLDTGDILLSQEIAILDDDNTITLSHSLAYMGASLLVKTIHGIRDGSVSPRPQQNTPSYAPPLKKEGGRITWDRNARDLFNFVRGMYPWPGAFSSFRARSIKFLDTRPSEGNGEPGKIASLSSDTFQIGTGNGLLSIIKVHPEGKSVMDARSFMNGYRIREGETFV